MRLGGTPTTLAHHLESGWRTQNEEEMFALRPQALRPMNVFPALFAAVATAAAITVTVAEPAAAQWGFEGLSRQQLRQQRSNGWSSGDYFAAPQQPRLQQQRFDSGYTPGLQQNLRYRQGSCAMYLNC